MASADPNASRLAGWRVALRIARRDALRSRGRSALVIVMIGLPVMLSTAVAVLASTNSLSEAEQLPRRLGTAQAELRDNGRAPVVQDALAANVQTPDQLGGRPPAAEQPAPKPWTAAELSRLTGGEVVTVSSSSTTVVVPTGRAGTNMLQTDADLRLLAGKVDLLSGRPPKKPDEVLVDRSLRDRGLKPGAALRLGPDAVPATVVGVARFPESSGSATVLVRPGLLDASLAGSDQFLLIRPTALGWDEVLRLNRSGVSVYSRAVVLDPPPADTIDPRLGQTFSSNGYVQGRAVPIIVISSVMIEVVLLAGPAFAVGVRRQQRQLALLAATGADRAQVRRSVLAGGLVLGAGASVAGALLGLGLALAVIRLTGRYYNDAIFGPLDIRWPAVAGAVGLGTLAALLAALVPARQAAKLDVVAALTGRRAEARASRGWPVAGAVLAGLGALITLTLGTRPGGETRVAFGTIIAVVGLVALMPLLVGLVGRTATRLPVPLRIAVRDGARHRSRTAPAVAAVMGVVAGVTALAIGGASDSLQNRTEYTPQLAMGTTALSFSAGASVEGITGAAERVLPNTRWLTAGSLGTVPDGFSSGSPTIAMVPQGCTPDRVIRPLAETDQPCQSWQVDPSLVTPSASYSIGSGKVAPLETLPALRFALTADQRALLGRGGVLVSNPRLVRPDGTADLIVWKDDGGTAVPPLTFRKTVPAGYLAPPDQYGQPFAYGLVTTPETASRLGLPWTPDQLVLTGDARVSPQQENDLGDAVRVVDDSASAYTERGFRDPLGIPFLILAVAAGIAVLVGTLTATGLALADARPDLATLAAVGASPRSRRVMAGAHALVIGLLGTLTGTALGFLPGIAVTFPLTSGPAGSGPYLAVPWTLLLAVALAVPVLGAVVAALSHRTRQPLTRRV